jgi:hypothetical protein
VSNKDIFFGEGRGGGKNGQIVHLITNLHLVPVFRMRGALRPLLPLPFIKSTATTLATLQKATISFVVFLYSSICPSASNKLATNRQSFIKFSIKRIFRKSVEKIQV